MDERTREEVFGTVLQFHCWDMMAVVAEPTDSVSPLANEGPPYRRRFAATITSEVGLVLLFGGGRLLRRSKRKPARRMTADRAALKSR